MKKLFIAALLSVLFIGTANAQTMKAFNNVSVGVEVGIMGLGFQASMPLVDDKLVLDLGYNLYPGKFNQDINVKKDNINKGLEGLNKKIEEIPGGVPGCEKINLLKNDVTIGAKAELSSNFKAMLEWYPFKKGTFHITGGVMIGSGDFLTASGVANDEAQNAFQAAKKNQKILRDKGILSKDEDLVFNTVRFNIDDHTYAINENSEDLSADITLKINKVKPYLGFGFGRAIPMNRVGFQFELGAWYHGTPTISSSREIKFDPKADGIDGVGDVLKKVKFFPQMTFRLIGRVL